MIHETEPVLIGYLNKQWGLKQFEIAEPGHPVFEINERYVIYLKSTWPLNTEWKGEKLIYKHFYVCVPFYKETLKNAIDFISQSEAIVKPNY